MTDKSEEEANRERLYRGRRGGLSSTRTFASLIPCGSPPCAWMPQRHVLSQAVVHATKLAASIALCYRGTYLDSGLPVVGRKPQLSLGRSGVDASNSIACATAAVYRRSLARIAGTETVALRNAPPDHRLRRIWSCDQDPFRLTNGERRTGFARLTRRAAELRRRNGQPGFDLSANVIVHADDPTR